MYCVFLVIAISSFCVASQEIVHKSQHVELENRHEISKRTSNRTYVDKDDYMLRVPTINYLDEHMQKKKPKKSPKRTIQKIIKKNKGKLRKVYFNQVTKRSTVLPKVDNDKIYGNGQDEVKKWKMETTTKLQHKHRNRNSKVARYHMPFQKLQKKKEDRRYKRDLSKELFILKDLDQIEFLSKEKDNDVVKAHITDIWTV